MAKLLKYLGTGFIPGIPAADHVCEDDELAEQLVNGGGYEYADEKPAERKAREALEKASKAEANAKAAAADAAAKAEAEEKAKAAEERAETLNAQADASLSAAKKLIEEAKSDGKS